MEIPTLVVSDPPHREVNLEAASELLGLDVFATGLKATFAAPEILSAGAPGPSARLTASLLRTGFSVRMLEGSALADVPWPDPATALAIDDEHLRATVRYEGVELAYDEGALGVYCRPPGGFSGKPPVDPAQAVLSGHGPTIAEAIQWMSALDVYYVREGSLRRLSIVPELLGVDGEDVVRELTRRFRGLRIDARLAGVRPRARFVADDPDAGRLQRKGYSFGTARLCDVLKSIAPELRSLTHYELGSRLAYALSPLESVKTS